MFTCIEGTAEEFEYYYLLTLLVLEFYWYSVPDIISVIHTWRNLDMSISKPWSVRLTELRHYL